jgi:hypothetical protein
MKRLERVHNIVEAKVLAKEAINRFDEAKYYGTRWETHDGDYLFHTEQILTDIPGDGGLVFVNKEEAM